MKNNYEFYTIREIFVLCTIFISLGIIIGFSFGNYKDTRQKIILNNISKNEKLLNLLLDVNLNIEDKISNKKIILSEYIISNKIKTDCVYITETNNEIIFEKIFQNKPQVLITVNSIEINYNQNKRELKKGIDYDFNYSGIKFKGNKNIYICYLASDYFNN